MQLKWDGGCQCAAAVSCVTARPVRVSFTVVRLDPCYHHCQLVRHPSGGCINKAEKENISRPTAGESVQPRNEVVLFFFYSLVSWRLIYF